MAIHRVAKAHAAPFDPPRCWCRQPAEFKIYYTYKLNGMIHTVPRDDLVCRQHRDEMLREKVRVSIQE